MATDTMAGMGQTNRLRGGTVKPGGRTLGHGAVLISPATRRNWDRLAVGDVAGRLAQRANKTLSTRQILPVEYCSDQANIPVVQDVVAEIARRGLRVADAMFSLVLNCFARAGLTGPNLPMKAGVSRFLKRYSHSLPVEDLTVCDLPTGEPDLLGLIYQSVQAEGDRNRRGLYYTPPPLAARLTADLDFSGQQSILDPCCGSGSFLLGAPVRGPGQLLGVDVDPIAVMLCQANLIMRFPEHDFEPQVYCLDFLDVCDPLESADDAWLRDQQFDYVCTNPPWGAVTAPRRRAGGAKESFELFLRAGLASLTHGGVLRFLLPESFLNVAAFSGLRSDLLTRHSIKRIEFLPNLFSGVTTKAVALTVTRDEPSDVISVVCGEKEHTADAAALRRAPRCVLTHRSSVDERILNKLDHRGEFNLGHSTWALGIVTGNNAQHLHSTNVCGSEPIYTGKEVRPYRLLPPQKHIIYVRARFQQVARESIYRADEKLVYKFISNRLVFAYDNTRSLCLNSANILIPDIPSMSLRSALLFLNSELFQYAYRTRFGEIKVLKGNLCELPFPRLDQRLDEDLSAIATQLIEGDGTALSAAQSAVYDVYGLSPPEIAHVQEVLTNGTLGR